MLARPHQPALGRSTGGLSAASRLAACPAVCAARPAGPIGEQLGRPLVAARRGDQRPAIDLDRATLGSAASASLEPSLLRTGLSSSGVRDASCSAAGRGGGGGGGGTSSGSGRGGSRLRDNRQAGAPQTQAGNIARLVNRQLSEAQRLQDIEDCVDEWGSSFDAIHPATAFTRASRVVERGDNATPLLNSLADLWAERLDSTTTRAMSNVLLACARLSYANEALWSDTLAAYLQQGDAEPQGIANTAWALAAIAARNRGEVPGVPRQAVAAAMQQLGERMDFVLGAPSLQDSVIPQDVSHMLWAHAKLQLQPGEDELAGQLKVFTRPSMLGAAAPQAVANVLWALSELHKLPDWQCAVKPRVWERLLAEEQVARLADQGDAQNVANSLLALGRLGAGAAPLIAHELAQQAALQLLQGKVAQQVSSWTAQHVGNSLWACTELGLREPAFLAGVEGSVSSWLLNTTATDVTQAAVAAGSLHWPALLPQLMQRGRQLLGQQGCSGGRGQGGQASANDRISLAAGLGAAVAGLDLVQLAGEAKALVGAAGFPAGHGLKPAPALRLWTFHTWLVQRELLDGQGLAGLLSPQQLAAGQAEAASWQASGGTDA